MRSSQPQEARTIIEKVGVAFSYLIILKQIFYISYDFKIDVIKPSKLI
jgi:hypothetical protein